MTPNKIKYPIEQIFKFSYAESWNPDIYPMYYVLLEWIMSLYNRMATPVSVNNAVFVITTPGHDLCCRLRQYESSIGLPDSNIHNMLLILYSFLVWIGFKNETDVHSQ